MPEFKAYVMPGSHGERELIRLLRSMVKQDVPWRDLFEIGTLLSSLWRQAEHHILSPEAFFKPEPEKMFLVRSDSKASPHFTYLVRKTAAWGGEFIGDLANVFIEIIADYLSKDRHPYARMTTIVNSSGTGKSRMVDQLGTEIIVVPMCLRRGRSEGFCSALSL